MMNVRKPRKAAAAIALTKRSSREYESFVRVHDDVLGGCGASVGRRTLVDERGGRDHPGVGGIPCGSARGIRCT